MKKQKIIIIILAIIIALLVVYIFFGQYIFGNSLTTQTLNGEPQKTASLIQGDQNEGVIPDNSEDTISAADTEDLFFNIESYAGKNVQIEGTIYTDPQNNQGILSFNIKTDGSHYASINYLDMGDTFKLNKNDHVVIEGIVTNSVQSKDSSGEEISMPMINAASIVKK